MADNKGVFDLQLFTPDGRPVNLSAPCSLIIPLTTVKDFEVKTASLSADMLLPDEELLYNILLELFYSSLTIDEQKALSI